MSYQPHPQPNKEKINIWLPFILAITMSGGVWLGFQIHARTQPYAVSAEPGSSLPSQGGSKVEEVLRFIDARYLEGTDHQKLQEAAIEGLLSKLDPHSSYISSDELEGVNESLAGGFEGVGVEFSIVDDTVYVVGVVPDGPSDKAGVRVGDKLLRVGDSTVVGIGITNKGIISKLKGSAGSSVEVQLLRPLDGLKTVQIQRAEIPMKSVDMAYMLDDKTGYIKINRFSGKTYKEFMEELQRLMEQNNMKDLVIDVRQNPGGYLDQATEILSQLFEGKKLLVYTEGRSYKRKESMSSGKNFFKVGKIAVLVDEGSASASEIVAGAIQDNDRGIIVGRRTYGKGLVQEQYNLSDRSALRLTVARYYTPSGRLIQRPYEKGKEAYETDYQERTMNGELFHKDSIKITDSTKYYTTGGRVVYGGGGIIPDLFVPMDTIFRSRYFSQATGLIPSFVYKYYDRNFVYFKRFKILDDFLRNFQVDANLLNEFQAHCQKKGLSKDERAWAASKDQLALFLKAYLAKQLFRDMGFYRVLHQQDNILKKALAELQRNTAPTANK